MPQHTPRLAILSLALLGALGTSHAQDETTADGLNWSGVTRARWEGLDGQFRNGLSGDDQVIALRTLVGADYRSGRWQFLGELQDSRTYIDDDGTPLGTSLVNVAALLQAFAAIELSPDSPHSSRLRFGRFTLDIGSRRFVERNSFRNTINSYTGVHWEYRRDGGAMLDAFYVRPVQKLPLDRASLDANEYDADESISNERYWGIHFQRPDLIGDIQFDAFAYGLKEWDQPGRFTADRDVWETGFRLLRRPRRGLLDFEFETSFRFGSRSATVLAGAPEQKVRAHLLHAEAGYTFEHSWSPRLSLEYNLVTGDRASEDRYERYERFYGTRRRDLGNTSIYGPLTRSNVEGPAVRLTFARDRTDGQILLQYASLESATDAWLMARLEDPTGSSGKTLGTMLDVAIRHWLQPDRLRLEFGGSGLWYGSFPRTVPNGPTGSRTLYAFTQIEFFF